MSLLEIENVKKDFSGLRVLIGIDLEIPEGERHAIIGPNGAGKTTLFNIISGHLRSSSGRKYFMGRDITTHSAHRVARLGIARSFQITNIFPQMTIFENVRNAVLSKCDRRFNWVSLLSRNHEITKETDETIERFSLTDVRDSLASELSYGMQRKLEIAITMAMDPILVMLDEPAAGLNTDETRTIVELIREVTVNCTLMIIEHDMDAVFSIADRITVLDNGKILITDTPEQIRENEEVQKAYLRRKEDVN